MKTINRTFMALLLGILIGGSGFAQEGGGEPGVAGSAPTFEEFRSEDGNVILKVDNDLLEGTGAKIYFYNKTGELTGQWKYEGLLIDQYRFPNRTGKYWVIQMYPHKYSGEKSLKWVFILDSRGKELGKFETYAGVSGLPLQESYFLSREESTIRAHALTGKIIWERKLPEGASDQSESKISPNGRYVVLNEGEDGVVLLDRYGKELFRRKLHIAKNKHGWSALFVRDVNDEGAISLVPTGKENKVIVLDKAGKIKADKKTTLEPYRVRFSLEDPNQLVVEDREGKKEILKVEEK